MPAEPIPPALSAAEWGDTSHGIACERPFHNPHWSDGSAPGWLRGAVDVMIHMEPRHNHVALHYETGRDSDGRQPDGMPSGMQISPSIYPALVAVLNFALPGDDPRKITRDDVALLYRLADDPIALSAADHGLDDAVRALAAKLASLLPPTPRP